MSHAPTLDPGTVCRADAQRRIASGPPYGEFHRERGARARHAARGACRASGRQVGASTGAQAPQVNVLRERAEARWRALRVLASSFPRRLAILALLCIASGLVPALFAICVG